MPAYFSLTFELNKSRNAVGAFCKTLIHCGPVFKSGYWGFEDDSRLFIMNHRRTPVFSFELIVPEGNLWVYTEENRAACSVQGKLERMELLKSVAKRCGRARICWQSRQDGSFPMFLHRRGK